MIAMMRGNLEALISCKVTANKTLIILDVAAEIVWNLWIFIFHVFHRESYDMAVWISSCSTLVCGSHTLVHYSLEKSVVQQHQYRLGSLLPPVNSQVSQLLNLNPPWVEHLVLGKKA